MNESGDMTRMRIEGGPGERRAFLSTALPEKVGGEGMQSKQEGHGSGEAALLSAQGKGTGIVHEEKRGRI